MSKFRIIGSQKLVGQIAASGAKNAALKMIAASLLGSNTITLHNVPRIIDVDVMLQLIRQFGVSHRWQNEHTLVLDANNVKSTKPSPDLVRKLRASFVLVGPALARFGSIIIPFPGGDKIGKRPLGTHLDALKQLGIIIDQDQEVYILNYQSKKSATVFLQEPSVTATENSLLASILGTHTTTIYGAAVEPEIGNLINLLTIMGAKIFGKDTPTLVIEAVPRLGTGEVTIIPDRIEIGTFLMAALITKGNVTVTNAEPGQSNYLIPRLQAMGAQITLGRHAITASVNQPLKAVTVDTRPYPGFYTDLQSPMAALCTQATGTSTIFETMYEGRFNYVPALKEMGANIRIEGPHRILITGPTPLSAKNVTTDDIRAGAALVLAGLAAEGQTLVNNIELIDRGYERLDKKLQSLGADIKRID